MSNARTTEKSKPIDEIDSEALRKDKDEDDTHFNPQHGCSAESEFLTMQVGGNSAVQAFTPVICHLKEHWPLC